MASIVAGGIRSTGAFGGLVLTRRLHLRKTRLGRAYAIEGGSYSVFRETHKDGVGGESSVLVIGFRLRLIRSSRLLHRIFQKVCILTTPIWSGLPGFRIKLWMVETDNKDYLGVYDWRGTVLAQEYLKYLLPILRFFSVRGSVWAKCLAGEDMEEYLRAHALGA